MLVNMTPTVFVVKVPRYLFGLAGWAGAGRASSSRSRWLHMYIDRWRGRTRILHTGGHSCASQISITRRYTEPDSNQSQVLTKMLNGNVGNVLGAEWMRTGEDKDRCIETILSSVNSASQERSCGKLSMRRLSLAYEDIWFE